MIVCDVWTHRFQVYAARWLVRLLRVGARRGDAGPIGPKRAVVGARLGGAYGWSDALAAAHCHRQQTPLLLANSSRRRRCCSGRLRGPFLFSCALAVRASDLAAATALQAKALHHLMSSRCR